MGVSQIGTYYFPLMLLSQNERKLMPMKNPRNTPAPNVIFIVLLKLKSEPLVKSYWRRHCARDSGDLYAKKVLQVSREADY